MAIYTGRNMPKNAPFEAVSGVDVGDRAPSRRSAESALRSPRLPESGLRNCRKQACSKFARMAKASIT
jgi:hypothetical protein